MALMVHAQDMSKRFGAVVALDGVDIALHTHRAHGLIGPNGSGKSTLLAVITGVMRHERGHVEVDGTDVTGWPAHRIARLGVARSFQTARVFPALSVGENIAAGAMAARRPGVDILIGELASRLDLADVIDERAGELSYGVQRRVEVGRALATDPRCLILDEPAAGLDEHESVALSDVLGQLRDDGIALLVVDHDIELIRALCDSVQVLAEGRTLATGDAEEVLADPAVRGAYLGLDGDVPADTHVMSPNTAEEPL